MTRYLIEKSDVKGLFGLERPIVFILTRKIKIYDAVLTHIAQSGKTVFLRAMKNLHIKNKDIRGLSILEEREKQLKALAK